MPLSMHVIENCAIRVSRRRPVARGLIYPPTWSLKSVYSAPSLADGRYHAFKNDFSRSLEDWFDPCHS